LSISSADIRSFISSTVIIPSQQLYDPSTCLILPAEVKLDSVLIPNGTQYPVKGIALRGLCLDRLPLAIYKDSLFPSRILPKNDILKALDAVSVLTQEDYADSVIIGPLDLPSESVVILANIRAKFRQILLAVYDKSSVIKAHVVPDGELAYQVAHSQPVKLRTYSV
jgi:hypothetical protein